MSLMSLWLPPPPAPHWQCLTPSLASDLGVACNCAAIIARLSGDGRAMQCHLALSPTLGRLQVVAVIFSKMTALWVPSRSGCQLL